MSGLRTHQSRPSAVPRPSVAWRPQDRAGASRVAETKSSSLLPPAWPLSRHLSKTWESPSVDHAQDNAACPGADGDPSTPGEGACVLSPMVAQGGCACAVETCFPASSLVFKINEGDTSCVNKTEDTHPSQHSTEIHPFARVVHVQTATFSSWPGRSAGPSSSCARSASQDDTSTTGERSAELWV